MGLTLRAHLFRAVIFLGLWFLSDMDLRERVRIVDSVKEVHDLQEKYPRETMIISKLSVAAVAFGERRERW